MASRLYWHAKRVCVTGGAGFLGRVVCRRLAALGAADVFVPRSFDFDLTDPDAVARMLARARPDVVIHLAAEVGGIGANRRRPGRFFYANMAMGLHLIERARRVGVEKFVQVGSVCAYPRDCPVPFRETDLWRGYPEATNAPYGVTKRALGVMLDAYRAEYGFNGVYLLPVNLYGPHDNFDAETSHVIPSLIRRLCTAVDRGDDRVVCWGTGRASREFMFVDDAADAIVAAAATVNDPEPINLGTGREITIADLAGLIAGITGFSGDIAWDASLPDGQPRRRLDTSRAVERFGWRATVDLEDGLRRTIDWWRANRVALAAATPADD
ncbi:MAG: GDP-L-fucose synthase family protein [Phycisphaerae bacterium]